MHKSPAYVFKRKVGLQIVKNRKKGTINGFKVEVTYTKLNDGTIKISDAWVIQ